MERTEVECSAIDSTIMTHLRIANPKLSNEQLRALITPQMRQAVVDEAMDRHGVE